MFIRMKQRPAVDNLRNYPAEIIKELEELLLSGGSALPDPKRKGFYDLENYDRTFFIQISSITGKVALLATWRKALSRRFATGSYQLEERNQAHAYQLYEQHRQRNRFAFAPLFRARARTNSP